MRPIVGIFLGLLALAALIGGTWAYQWFTADVRGAIGAREQIKARGAYRIDRYEQFFNKCAAVQAHEATLKAQRELLASAETQKERGRINANIAGITAQRARVIAEYNADAAKDYTAGQFRDSDLPYRLSLESEATRCAS